MAAFTRYDDLAVQIQKLGTVDQDYALASNRACKSREIVSSINSQLAAEEKEIYELGKRIHRNENPGFFRWLLTCNREAKVERLKQEQVRAIEKKSKRVVQKAEQEKLLRTHEEELANVSNVVKIRDGLESERQAIFNKVVFENPSARLTQIESNIMAQKKGVSEEERLLHDVEVVINSLRQSESLYSEAIKTLERADKLNVEAIQIEQRVLVENVESSQEGMTQEEIEDKRKTEKERLDQAELNVQLKRDQLINEAQTPVEEAYMVNSKVWQTFPQQARVRYPTLCEQVGFTPLPRLESSSQAETFLMDEFLGDKGKCLNNSFSSDKIHRNIQVIKQCIAHLENQIRMLISLQTAIRRTVSTMHGNLYLLEGQKEEERSVIFESVRITSQYQY